jgi:hypothetical protein
MSGRGAGAIDTKREDNFMRGNIATACKAYLPGYTLKINYYPTIL